MYTIRTGKYIQDNICTILSESAGFRRRCDLFFSFYLLVKLFMLPELIALVNKDLQKHFGVFFDSLSSFTCKSRTRSLIR